MSEMKPNDYESSRFAQESPKRSINHKNGQTPQSARHFEQPEEITFSMLFQRLAGGFRLLWIALKYRIMKLMGLTGAKKSTSWKLSLFKVSMVAVIIILVTQKDIRFSVNLRAPLAGIGKSEEAPKAIATSNKALGQFSLSDALQMGKDSPDDEKVPEVSALNSDDVNEYVSRFSKVAVAEMRKFGIPASVKLAQAILESNAGKSSATTETKNHFGKPLQANEYVSAWENWRAHSLLLKNDYSALFDDAYGYKQWAKGLQKMKYNSDRNYAEKLIEVIEKYDLSLLDE